MASKPMFIMKDGVVGKRSHPTSSNWTMVIILLACMISMTFIQWFQYLKPARAIHDIMNSTTFLSYPITTTTTTTTITTRPRFKNLIFYNRPPKTGSTSVRIAMKRALDENGLISAKCFNMIEWNEMALRTIINRRNIDFYGCHTRLTAERYLELLPMRGHNITLMTSTREPSRIILSSYLQKHFRDVNITEVEAHLDIESEKKKYLDFVNTYPIDALYSYHGGAIPLFKCPVDQEHVMEMRRIAERYEIVVDLSKPEESAAVVQVVTGLKPNFGLAENVRVRELTPLLTLLLTVNTSHKTCGNELVHKILIQQYNLIKDRLLRNDCFNEDGEGNHSLCEQSTLHRKSSSSTSA